MSAKIVTPPLVRLKPSGERKPTIFLAGSIEMDTAEDWQAKAIEQFRTYASLIYNPRRAAWDKTWKQDIDSENFNVQVHWELDMIERADFVCVYFDPNTKSPISLLELGILAYMKPKQTYVCCPRGFWRSGNVEIVCERAGIRFYEDLPNMLSGVAGAMQQFQLR